MCVIEVLHTALVGWKQMPKVLPEARHLLLTGSIAGTNLSAYRAVTQEDRCLPGTGLQYESYLACLYFRAAKS
jgi:hypothetical protein